MRLNITLVTIVMFYAKNYILDYYKLYFNSQDKKVGLVAIVI